MMQKWHFLRKYDTDVEDAEFIEGRHEVYPNRAVLILFQKLVDEYYSNHLRTVFLNTSINHQFSIVIRSLNYPP